MTLFYSLLSLGLLNEAGFLLLITQNNLSEQSGLYVGTFAAVFGLFVVAIYLVLTDKFPTKPGLKGSGKKNRLKQEKPASLPPAVPAGSSDDNKADRKAVLALIVFFAILFRLTTIFIAPTLSTDQFRYTWERRLVTLGISPYRYAPADPALTQFHSAIWPLVQQKETASPYPPLAQLMGALEYSLLGDSIFGPKIAAAFFDVLVCLVLLWLLSIFKLDLRRVILYAWYPLPIIEFSQSGHNDGLMLLLMLVAVGLALKNRPTLSAFILGLAILAKFTPLFAMPLFLICWEGGALAGTWAGAKVKLNWNWQVLLKPRYWRYPALTLAVVVAGYVPFLILGGGAIGSIFEYTGTWRDNEGFIYQLAFQLGGIYPAKIVSLVILAVTVLLLSFHPRLATELTLPRRITLVFGVTLIVASTVHSSYISWLLIWLPLVWGKGFKSWDTAWLLFALLIQLYYLNYAPKPEFPLKFWINPLEYWPLHLLIGWNIYTWWKNGHAGKIKIVLKELKEGL